MEGQGLDHVGMEALPFSQQYRFTFRQVNGRAVVDTVDSRAR
jgi:hypothetical protein